MTKEKALELLLSFAYDRGYKRLLLYPTIDVVVTHEQADNEIKEWTFEGLIKFITEQ